MPLKTTGLLTGSRLAHEVELDAGGEGTQLLAAAEELLHRLPTLLAVIAREVVHVHGDEAIGELGVEPAAEPERVLHGLGAVGQAGLDRLAQDLGELVQDVGPEVAARHVDPEWKRQTRLEQPP